MSWFTINTPASATTVTNISPGNLTPAQVQLQQMQLEQMRLQHQAQMAQAQAGYQNQYANQYANTHTHPLGGWGQPSTAGHTHGMGGYYVGQGPLAGATVVSSACGPQIYPYPAQEGTYYIALPSHPTEGDHITLKFRHGGWREERSCAAEINPKKNNSGVFSLDEIDEARELIDELSAT